MTADALSLAPDVVLEQCAPVRYAHASPWLARRALRFGASDVPAVLLAYDPRPDEIETAREYHREAARITQTRRGPMPMVVARKAGLRKPQRTSDVMRRGTEREEALLRLWAAHSPDIAPRSLVLASEMLPHARHIVDHHCPALAATLDAVALDLLGEPMVVEGKCPRDWPDALPWYHRVQVQGQLAATDYTAGALVVGPGWGAVARLEDIETDPIAWMVERSEDEIARIREACTRAAADLARAMEEA
jgi:hypothetical protein